MQEKLIHKLNIRAEKTLTLKEVKLNDINFNKTIDYLTNQKFLGFKEIYEILHARNKNEDFPIGNIVEDKEGRIVGFMGTFYSQKKKSDFFLTLCNIHSWIIDKNIEIIHFFYFHHCLIIKHILQHLHQSKV